MKRLLASAVLGTAIVAAMPAAHASDGKLGDPAASSMTVVKKCDRVVKRVATTDADGDLLYWKKVIRFRECHR